MTTPVTPPVVEEEPKPATPPAEPAPTTATDPDGGVFDKERALSTIRTQREAEKELKKALADAKAKAEKWDKHEADKLTEEEKAKKDRDAALAKAQDADIRLRKANLIAELAKPDYGIVDARAASKLIEGVEYDDDGEPTNLGKPDEDGSLIKTFLAAHRFLLNTGAKPPAPSTNGGADSETVKPNLTAAEVSAAAKYGLTNEEYAVFKNGGSIADLEKAGLKKD